MRALRPALVAGLVASVLVASPAAARERISGAKCTIQADGTTYVVSATILGSTAVPTATLGSRTVGDGTRITPMSLVGGTTSSYTASFTAQEGDTHGFVILPLAGGGQTAKIVGCR